MHFDNCFMCQYRKNPEARRLQLHECVVTRCSRCDKNTRIEKFTPQWDMCKKNRRSAENYFPRDDLSPHLQICIGRAKVPPRFKKALGADPRVGFQVRGAGPVNETVLNKGNNMQDNQLPAKEFLYLESFHFPSKIVKQRRTGRSPHNKY